MTSDIKYKILKLTGIYSQEDRDILQLATDSTNILPESLYRYRSCSKDNFDSLEKDYVWLSHPNEYNDPDDSRVFYDPIEAFSPQINRSLNESLSKERKKDLIKTLKVSKLDPMGGPANIQLENLITKNKLNIKDSVKRELEEFVTAIKDFSIHRREVFKQYIFDMTSICSFSTHGENLLMWSHYSESHKGFCIEYPSKNLCDDYSRIIVPACYLTEPVDITEKIKSFDPQTSKMGGPILGSSMIKNKIWEYEDEWRLILMNSEIRKLPVQKPSAVYVGINTNEENREKIIEICQAKGVPVYSMVRKEGFGVQTGQRLI